MMHDMVYNIVIVMKGTHHVMKGTHHVMRSSRPSPSLICRGSKVKLGEDLETRLLYICVRKRQEVIHSVLLPHPQRYIHACTLHKRLHVCMCVRKTTGYTYM